jgi:hypothetical protein
MDQNAYNIRYARWEKLICEANSSGMPKIEWCRLHGISENQFYYWQKRVRTKAITKIQQQMECNALSPQNSSFIELSPPADSAITDNPLRDQNFLSPADHQTALVLRFGAFEIQVNSPEAEATLRMVMKVLHHA